MLSVANGYTELDRKEKGSNNFEKSSAVMTFLREVDVGDLNAE